MQTKKKSKKIIFKVILLGVILIVLALLSKFAWAKYMTSLNGNSKADIAKWSFKVNDKTNEIFTINLANTRIGKQEAEVQDGYIGPGTSGEFIIEVDATDTEVSLEYNINMAVDYNYNTLFPKNLIFYSDSEMKNAIYHTENGITLNGFIAQSDENKTILHTIYWKWDFETGQTQTDKDKNDIADSYWIGQNISIPIIVVGQQVNQNPTTNQYAVIFNANGGIIEGYGNSEKLTKIVNDNNYGELPLPSKNGYVFKKWSENLLDGASFTEEYIVDSNSAPSDYNNLLTSYIPVEEGKIYIFELNHNETYVEDWCGYVWYTDMGKDFIIGSRNVVNFTNSFEGFTISITAPPGAKYLRIGARHMDVGKSQGGTEITYANYSLSSAITSNKILYAVWIPTEVEND